MYQGTTPAIVYTISGVDLSAMKAFVSFRSGRDVLTKSGDKVNISYDSTADKTTVICALTQEETLAFQRGNVETQIRFISANGEAYATNTAKINAKEVIYKEIISYGGDGE